MAVSGMACRARRTVRLTEIHLEVGEAQLRGLVAASPPKQGPDPGRQFWKSKRLDQVVVRAEVQAEDLVLERVLGRQDEDGRPLVVLAQGAAGSPSRPGREASGRG